MGSSSEKQYRSGLVYFLILTSSLGWVFFGFMIAIFTPVQDYFQTFIFPGLTDDEAGTVIAVLSIGAAIGSALVGQATHSIGRKNLIIILDIIALIASFVSLIENLAILMVARLILGFIVGMNSVLTLLYAIEITPNDIRGYPGTICNLMLAMGILMDFIIGLYIPGADGPQSNLWMLLFALPGCVCLVRTLILLTCFNYETPKFLILKHRDEDCREVVSKIYFDPYVESKMEELKKEREIELERSKSGMKLRDLFRPRFLKRTMLGIFISSFLNLSGIQIVNFYADQVFKQGLPDPNSSTIPQDYAFYTELINVVFLLIAVLVSNRVGRKALLMGGTLVTIGSHLGFYFTGYYSNDTSLFSKNFILLYMVCYSISLGPAGTIYMSEVCPSLALGVGWFAGWVSAVVGAQAFPILVQAYGLDNVFLIEAIICTIALFIQGIFMVESKGKSNTEIDELFYKRDNKLDQTLEPIMNSQT